MSQRSLESFGAYRRALELFDLVVEDMGTMTRDPRTWRLVSQQVASADSICANIEEGHGRGTRRDYAHFLDISRGSAREVRGRYLRLKHWLPQPTIAKRVAVSDDILGILTTTIETLRGPGGRA